MFYFNSSLNYLIYIKKFIVGFLGGFTIMVMPPLFAHPEESSKDFVYDHLPQQSYNLSRSINSFDVNFYNDNVVELAKEFISLTPSSQLTDLIKPFSSSERTKGRDTDSTPSFCAALSWCIGWGIPQHSMSNAQKTAMHKMLSIALSSGGYQTFLAILNRQRIIGEMEDRGTNIVIKEATEEYPTDKRPSIFDFSSLSPFPLDKWYPEVGGFIKPEFPGDLKINWVWNPPGLEQRYKDFGNYSILFLGNPGDDKWAIRFEGHHVSLNLTFIKGNNNGYKVYATPLFIGSFPMIIPENVSLTAQTPQIMEQWKWSEGQVMMFSSTYYIRKFWNSLTQITKDKAFNPPDKFVQGGPLIMDTPPPFLISTLDTQVDIRKILNYNVVSTYSSALPPKAIWYLKQAFFTIHKL